MIFRRKKKIILKKPGGIFFRILVLEKLEIFMLELFLILTGICFPCIKNNYWLFVIQTFSVIHLFIISTSYTYSFFFFFDANSFSKPLKGKENILQNSKISI